MIRYIVKVDYMPAVHLKLAQPLPAVQKVVITDYMPWQPLPIVDWPPWKLRTSCSSRLESLRTSWLAPFRQERPSPSVRLSGA